jgi:hypothetical protein
MQGFERPDGFVSTKETENNSEASEEEASDDSLCSQSCSGSGTGSEDSDIEFDEDQKSQRQRTESAYSLFQFSQGPLKKSVRHPNRLASCVAMCMYAAFAAVLGIACITVYRTYIAPSTRSAELWHLEYESKTDTCPTGALLISPSMVSGSPRDPMRVCLSQDARWEKSRDCDHGLGGVRFRFGDGDGIVLCAGANMTSAVRPKGVLYVV